MGQGGGGGCSGGGAVVVDEGVPPRVGEIEALFAEGAQREVTPELVLVPGGVEAARGMYDAA